MSVKGGLPSSVWGGRGQAKLEINPNVFRILIMMPSLNLPVWNKYWSWGVLSAVNIVDIIQICCVPFYSLDGCRNSKLLMPFSIFLHGICYGRLIICYSWHHPTSPWYLSKAAAPLITTSTSSSITILTPGQCVDNWLRWDGHALQVLHRQRVALRAEQHYTVQDIIHAMEIQDI